MKRKVAFASSLKSIIPKIGLFGRDFAYIRHVFEKSYQENMIAGCVPIANTAQYREDANA